jgi:transposase
MRNVALDLGARKIAYCEVLDGQVTRRLTVSSVDSLRPVLGPDEPPATVAIEACREAWHVYDRLTEWGNRVLLVDTTRSKQMGIGRHGRKTDKIDAEVMARAVEQGSIPAAHVLSPHRRELRRQLGVRRALVETRANLVVTVRGLAREHGRSLPGCDTENFVRKVQQLKLDESLQALIDPLLVTLDTVQAQLGRAEEELGKLCAHEPVIPLLCTAPGVGAVVAASFVAVIDEAGRFPRAHQLESYLGLVPGEDSSGGKRRIGAITKKGNSYLRALLVQGSWTILQKADRDDPMRRWGEAVARRRGKRIAVVAVARRLAGVLFAMWRDRQVYDPQLLASRSASGLRGNAARINFQADSLQRAKRKRSCRMLSQEVSQQV